MSKLDEIIGLTVENAEEIEDYIQLIISNNKKLSIFNNYICNSSLKNIENKKIIAIESSEDILKIFFEENISLFIGLDDESYNSPEAMVLLNNGIFTVWN